MARGMMAGSAMAVTSTGSFAVSLLNRLPFFVCVVAVVGLCIGYARHRVLHGNSETDDVEERIELRTSGQALSSNLQIKRHSLKNSFLLKHSFSRSVSSKQGNGANSDDMIYEPTALWQKVILRGERCVPLSFSGLILYDEKGNLLPRRNKSFIQAGE